MYRPTLYTNFQIVFRFGVSVSGHQCIANASRKRVIRATRPMHGRSSYIMHGHRELFTNSRHLFAWEVIILIVEVDEVGTKH